MNIFSLEGKVALVTGAAKGNGKAISEGLLTAGAKVVAIDILEPLNKNNEIDFYVCDITDQVSVKKILKKIEKKYNKVDILINNAGVTKPKEFMDYDEESWNKTFEVNLKAPFFIMKEVFKIMKNKNTNGSVVNITSLNSELAFPDNPAYVAAKGALKQLTKSAALDMGKHKIRVNNVGPGYFTTDMTKKSWNDLERRKFICDKTVLDRWGNPQDLVGITVFLASEASSYITGQDIYVDGGWLIKGM